MKKNYALVMCGVFALLIFTLHSCTVSGTIKCPDMTARRSHPLLITKSTHHEKPSKTDKVAAFQQEEKINAPHKMTEPLMALAGGDAPFMAKVPNYISRQMDEDEFEKVNAAFNNYSNHKVSLERNEKGKVVLMASSKKELTRLTTTILSQKPACISEETKDILGLVGGILGIVSISFSVIPYAGWIAFPTGIAAIVLGALGLHSTRRHKWALLGIILGSIGIFLAIAFSFIWYGVVFGIWII